MIRLQPGRQGSGTESVRGERTCFQESLRALRRVLGAAPGSPLPASRSPEGRARSQAQGVRLGGSWAWACSEPPPAPARGEGESGSSKCPRASGVASGRDWAVRFGSPRSWKRAGPEGGFHGAGGRWGRPVPAGCPARPSSWSRSLPSLPVCPHVGSAWLVAVRRRRSPRQIPRAEPWIQLCPRPPPRQNTFGDLY